MQQKSIPILLLTGYLGSGKTTLLNNILNNRRGIKFAVVVNDIGEVNIDAELIQKGGIVGQENDSLIALQNGCICCTLKMDLVKQLGDILALQRFDYIVIEASGICEPAPIAQTINMMQRMPEFSETTPKLDCICTVVDALRMRDEFECGKSLSEGETSDDDIKRIVIEQIEFCNTILLNKASEIAPDELMRIKKIISTIQPRANIIECDYCDVDLNLLLNTGRFDFDAVATSATWIREIENVHSEEEHNYEQKHKHEHKHEDHHHCHCHEEHECHNEHCSCHHHHHTDGESKEYGIGTYVYYRRPGFDLNKFDYFVGKNWPANIIRAKGICYFKENPDMSYLFETAGKQKKLTEAGQWYATAPEEELFMMMRCDPNLVRDWDEHYGDRMIKIVFIGQHLDRKAIAAALDACI